MDARNPAYHLQKGEKRVFSFCTDAMMGDGIELLKALYLRPAILPDEIDISIDTLPGEKQYRKVDATEMIECAPPKRCRRKGADGLKGAARMGIRDYAAWRADVIGDESRRRGDAKNALNMGW